MSLQFRSIIWRVHQDSEIAAGENLSAFVYNSLSFFADQFTIATEDDVVTIRSLHHYVNG